MRSALRCRDRVLARAPGGVLAAYLLHQRVGYLHRRGLAVEFPDTRAVARNRSLRKPVEYYFIPDVDHGSHGLQNPRQLRALQGRALDWWRFWLKDERDPDPAKRAQYEAWDALREMHLKSSS